MGFLLFLVANFIFPLDEFVITISFLRLEYSQIACAKTLGIGRDYCIQVPNDVSQWAHLSDTFMDAFKRRWEFHQHSHPIYRHESAIVDSTHVAIQSPSHPVDRELSWFDKPTYRGHALMFNAMINWGREIIAWSWWYPPRATDAEMTADMDASIPWSFNGSRPDFRLGDCHYSTAYNMFYRVAGGNGRLTWFMVHCNQRINEGRHLVENVFSYVKKWRLWNAVMRLPGARITTTSLAACSFSAVTYRTWSRGTPKVYNHKSTGCNDVTVFYYARAYCGFGHRKCFVGNHVAITFFFKTKNWCAARRVVNLNRNGTMGTQEQDEISPNSGSR